MTLSQDHFIGGHWTAGAGAPFHSTDPATGQIPWQGHAATAGEIGGAIAAARSALDGWTAAPLEDRIAILNRYAEQLRGHKPALAEIICRETGKPYWEALTEVDAMAAKVAISIEAHHERRHPTQRDQAGALAATRYKPMGVMAVFGPFNMPGHLPNGHIVPALLAGNTIVFKPSEMTPAVGEKMAEMLHAAGIPAGVFNLVQGGREVGEALGKHPRIDGILFTGSVGAGLALNRALIDQPGKIVALEMGGNNPLVVWQAKDLDAAAYLTIQSAFITSGQRCSCARRLIVPQDSAGDAILERLVGMMRTIRVGSYTDRPEPFIGPVISDAAAERVLAARAELLNNGGISLLDPASDNLRGPSSVHIAAGVRKAFLRPDLIDVTRVSRRPDEEIFGPLLQVIRVPDFPAAMAEANATAFGLAAGLFSDNADLWQSFYRKIRSGVVYWNRQTTGGSSYLPFGGIGSSGNFRPSGYWAADYCSYPVASIEKITLEMPAQKSPGL